MFSARTFRSTVSLQGQEDVPSSVDGEDEELSEFIRQNNLSRSRRERSDSVTEAIFRERMLHQKSAKELIVDPKKVSALEDIGLGLRKKKHIVYSKFTTTAAGVIASIIYAKPHC